MLTAGVWLIELAHQLRTAERDEQGAVRVSDALARAIVRRAEIIAAQLGATLPC